MAAPVKAEHSLITTKITADRSAEINMSGRTIFTIELPAANAADTLKIEVLSGDNTTWIELLTVTSTGRLRPLTPSETNAVAGFQKIRLFLSTSAGNGSNAYIHSV